MIIFLYDLRKIHSYRAELEDWKYGSVERVYHRILRSILSSEYSDTAKVLFLYL